MKKFPASRESRPCPTCGRPLTVTAEGALIRTCTRVCHQIRMKARGRKKKT